jgi:hypothetical protein
LRQVLGLWMIGLMIGAFAVVSLALGARGIIQRTPYRIASRKLYLLSIACYLPALAYLLLELFPLRDAPLFRTPSLAIPLGISVFLLVFVLWIYSRETNSFTFMGVHPAAFYEAVTCTLQAMRLDYQDNNHIITLVDSGLDLRVTAVDWIGLGQLQARQKDYPEVLEQIAAGIEAYFEGQKIRAMIMPSAAYLTMGTLMTALALLYVIATGPVALGLK